jgi:hypothetical protein
VPPVGGPVTLEETDRILQCNFCKTRLYIQPKDYFRYCFPYSAAVNEEIIYVPYWRFRGMSFKYRTSGTTNTLIDKTFLAIEDKSFPDTLGVRPQSLNIRFAQKKEQERYLEPKISFSMSSIQTDNHLLDAMLAIHDIKPALFNWGGAQNEADEAMAKINEDKLYYESFVAEKISLIYTPFFVRDNRLYDAVTGKGLSASCNPASLEGSLSDGRWDMRFLPTLCPQCGSDLTTERDSCVLVCNNCDTCWQASNQGDLRAAEYVVMTPANPDPKNLFLPFWKIKVSIDGMKLQSYGDLLKLSDLPMFVKCDRKESDLSFWTPAFKIASPIFLRTAHRMTLSNPERETRKELRDASLYPANVPLSEAVGNLKVVLLDMMLKKQDILPQLEKITITPVESTLVFYPFLDTGYELTEPEIKCGIMKNALKWGQSL